jgi:hypothetical protein
VTSTDVDDGTIGGSRRRQNVFPAKVGINSMKERGNPWLHHVVNAQ